MVSNNNEPLMRSDRKWLTDFGLPLLLVGGLSLCAVFAARALLPANLRLLVPTDYVTQYLPTGQSIAAGRGITRPNGDLSTTIPPGYPVIIAGVLKVADWTGTDFDRLMNLAIALFFAQSSIMLYFASRQIWSGPLRLIPPLLWIVCPFNLWLAQSPNVEVPFFVFLFLSIALFFAGFSTDRKALLFFLCGISIGVAMLIRPIALFMGVMFAALALAFEHRRTIGGRFALAIILIVGNVLIVAPWEIWLYSQTKRLMPLSSNGAANLELGLTFGINRKDPYEPLKLPTDVVDLMTELDKRIAPHSSQSGILSQALAVSRERPGPFLKLILIKAARSWYGTDSGRAENLSLLVQLPLLCMILLGLIFSVRAKLVAPVVWGTVLLSILYFWAMAMIVVPLIRYTAPVIGVGFLLVPATLFYLFRKGTTFERTNKSGTRDHAVPHI